ERRLSSKQHAALQIGSVILDSKTMQLNVDNALVELPRREFMLLKILMENAGRVQTRDSLESRLYSWGEEVTSNAIEVHVHHLRKKLPEGFIKTIRGVGYQISNT
ncbi:MAG TPA: DNA-binding response regulator, partial [Methylophaga sp.]|nr:DNA-binding response regulator [Methylophaga sp.]